MALDYQKVVYQIDHSSPNRQELQRSRTTYGGMSTWRGVVPDTRIVEQRYPLVTFDEDEDTHLRFYHSSGYDDSHRAYLAQHRYTDTHRPSLGLYGPPRVRQGRQGGGWRHVNEVMQAGGSRLVFVNDSIKVTDNSRLRNEEIPNGNVIVQSMIKKPVQKKMTAADMMALKASEFGNWHVMR